MSASASAPAASAAVSLSTPTASTAAAPSAKYRQNLTTIAVLTWTHRHVWMKSVYIVAHFVNVLSSSFMARML